MTATLFFIAQVTTCLSRAAAQDPYYTARPRAISRSVAEFSSLASPVFPLLDGLRRCHGAPWESVRRRLTPRRDHWRRSENSHPVVHTSQQTDRRSPIVYPRAPARWSPSPWDEAARRRDIARPRGYRGQGELGRGGRRG